MTLLNGLLALGALAFTVPLAIHLLFRSRFRTLDWGAMYLLESVVRINRRRLQLMNLLLLLLRCLLPILLAFCLARPVFTGFRVLPGDAPQSVVIVVDDSRSLAAIDESGATRMEQAQSDLRVVLENLSRRDEVIFVHGSRVDRPASSMGPQDALRRVNELTTHSGPVDLDRLLRAAVEAAKEASHAERRILVVSDFPSRMVGDNVMESLNTLSASMGPRETQPVISFLNYGVNSESLSNVSVDSIEVDSPAVVAGRGARFSARIRNASDRSAQDLRIVWSIDGQTLPPRTISIPPQSSATSRLTNQIEQPGVHEVTLAIESSDALAADNRRSIGVDVLREINVLLVDGKPSNQPLEGETDFLAIALSPFAFGGDDLPDAVRTKVVANRSLTISKAFDSDVPDIVVLANAKNLAEATQQILVDFVLDGGSLVIFDGDRVDPDSYNAGWSSERGTLSLPARLGEFVGETDKTKAKPMRIGQLNPQYTPWGLLESKDQQPLSEVDIYGYRKLIPIDELASQPTSDAMTEESGTEPAPLSPAITLLSMVGGDPIAVSARRGRGQVVQFAIPCDAEWSTLPMRMVYLPMIQQLMLDLAGTSKRTTIEVGDGFTVAVDELRPPEGDAITEEMKATYTVQPPAGAEETIEPSDEGSPQLVVGEALLPGTYRIRQSLLQKEADPLITSTLRVAEVPAEESQLIDADAGRLTAAAETVGAEIYRDVDSLLADDRTRRFGQEIWRWLLVALLIAMVGELFLQQFTVRKTISGGAS